MRFRIPHVVLVDVPTTDGRILAPSPKACARGTVPVFVQTDRRVVGHAELVCNVDGSISATGVIAESERPRGIVADNDGETPAPKWVPAAELVHAKIVGEPPVDAHLVVGGDWQIGGIMLLPLPAVWVGSDPRIVDGGCAWPTIDPVEFTDEPDEWAGVTVIRDLPTGDNRRPMFYVAYCYGCEMDVPFGSAEEMGRWAGGHVEATGHSLRTRVEQR